MNKVYKVIWSKSKNIYVVVSEFAKSRTKSPSIGFISHAVVAGVLASVISCGAVMPMAGAEINPPAAANYVLYVDSTAAKIQLEGSGGTKITGLAEGMLSAGSTEAVNGAQLYAVTQQFDDFQSALSRNNTSIARAQTDINNDYKSVINDLSLNNNILTYTKGDGTISNLVIPNASGEYSVAYDNANAEMITLVGPAGLGTKITNLANGDVSVASKDAVNGAQLYNVSQQFDSLHQSIIGLQNDSQNIYQNVLHYDDEQKSSVTLGDTTRPVLLHNLAPGVHRNDAVTVDQLDSAVSKLNLITFDNSGIDIASHLDSNSTIRIGPHTYAEARDVILIGGTAQSRGNSHGSIAIGSGAQTSGFRSTAVGLGSSASGESSFAIGTTASSMSLNGISLGANSLTSGLNSVALGSSSVADVDNVISVGSPSLKRRIVNVADGIDDSDVVTLGQMNSALSSTTTLVESAIDNLVSNYSDIPISNFLKYDDDSHSILTFDGLAGTKLTGLSDAELSSNSSDAVTGKQLYNVQNNLQNQTVHGVSLNITSSDKNYNNNLATGAGSIAIGINPKASNLESIAIGRDADASGSQSQSIGTMASSLGTWSVALGSVAKSAADQSVAIGYASTVAKLNSQNRATFNSVAIGHYSYAVANNSVALGSNSAVYEDNVVSVGHKASDKPAYGQWGDDYFRRIINVADGVDNHDVVTVQQLNASIPKTIHYVGVYSIIPIMMVVEHLVKVLLQLVQERFHLRIMLFLMVLMLMLYL